MSDAVTQAYENLAHTLVKPLLGDAKYEVKTRIKDGKLDILVDAEPSARGRLIGRGGKMKRGGHGGGTVPPPSSPDKQKAPSCDGAIL